jgi:hypothetical protein
VDQICVEITGPCGSVLGGNQHPAPDCGGYGPESFWVLSGAPLIDVLVLENAGERTLDLQHATVRLVPQVGTRSLDDLPTLVANTPAVRTDIFPLRRIRVSEALVIPLSVRISATRESPSRWAGPAVSLDSVRVDGSTYGVRAKGVVSSIRAGRADASCPFLYTQASPGGPLKAWGTVITDRVGWSRRGITEKALDRFYPTVVIAEEEQEVSYIDHVYLTGRDQDARPITLLPDVAAVRKADGNLATLREGEKLTLHFVEPAGGLHPPFQLVVDGFYIPTGRWANAERASLR